MTKKNYHRMSRSLLQKKSSVRFLCAIFTIFSVSLFGVFLGTRFVYAATYSFTQTSWSGGITANTAVHTTNQNGWTQYSSATSVAAGTAVTLLSTNYAFTDDGATSTSPVSTTARGGGFSNGANSTTTISGTGAAATIRLLPNTSGSTAWSWGDNWYGQLGNNSTAQSNVPAQVSGLTGVTAIAGGGYSGYALTSNGTAWAWGSGAPGSLGNNSTAQSNVPVQVSGLTGVTAIAGNKYSGYALKSDGTVWSWGDAFYGQLGNNSTAQSNVPVQVSGLTGVTAIGSSRYAGYALKSDGTVWSWGDNSSGQLGNNSTAQSNVPVQVNGLTGVIAIAGGNDSGYAVKSDGTAWSWGDNSWGQLGNNSTTQSNVPVQVSGLTGVTAIAGGASAGYALKSNGTVWSWGSNSSGSLGNNSSMQSNIPVQVSGLTGATAIAGGGYSGYALKSDGTVWSWGYGYYGQLGNNSINDSLAPVQVSGLTGASAIASSRASFASAIVSDSTASSGVFTSAVIDIGSPTVFSTIAFTKTTPAPTTLTIDVRAGNTATPDGTWTVWSTNVVSGGSIAALNGNRYIQYRANFTTTDSRYIPVLSDVTINYSQYVSTGSLTSSKYDAVSADNTIAKISWSATGTSTTETVKFQIRSSPDGIIWSNWCGASITCLGSDYFEDADNGVALAANHPLKIGGNDRYLQYQAFLTSGGSAQPTLNSVVIQYVVNAQPDFDATYGTNGITVAQVLNPADPNWGKVSIGYRVRDTDTSTGTVTPGFVTPSFEYSTDSGGTWTAIPAGDLLVADVTNKAVNGATYTTYTATWTASSTLSSVYSAAMKVRVTVNDNEASNNIAQAISNLFTLDTAAPIVGGGNAVLNSSTGVTTGSLIMTATDNSQLQYRACNDNTFPVIDVQSNSCAWSTLGANLASTTVTWTPTGAPNNETVYIQVRDAYGNIATKTIVSPPTPASFDYKDVSNVAVNAFWEFISWALFTNTTNSTFAAYKIYTSIDGSTYNLLTTITDPALNYYRDNITTATTSPHYYKMIAIDTDGDISHYTTPFSDVPNGAGGTDLIPPIITNITTPVANLKNTSAQVTFTTDKLSQATVQYRAAGASGWTTVPSVSYMTAQSVYLTGLTPNTTYNLQVKASDAFGNVSAYTAGPNFMTVGGPVITNVTAASVTDVSAVIFWNTNISSDSTVHYSSNILMTNSSTAGSIERVSCIAALCQHKVTISGLTAGIQYYYYVESTDGIGNTTTDTNNNTYYTFTTTLDNTPPTISAIATPVVAAEQAIVVWKTDELATSQVLYGSTAGDRSKFTTTDVTKSIYHVATLSGETTNAGAAGGDKRTYSNDYVLLRRTIFGCRWQYGNITRANIYDAKHW